MQSDNIIIGNATNNPALIIVYRFNKIHTKELEYKIYINARGIHPIIDELLTKNAIVIANVIKAIFFSKNKKY
jgi:hypothetical protein